jgi:hypothetical protein
MRFEDIQHRTIDDAGCAIWQHSCSNGHPSMRYQGKTQLVRRVLWEALHGPIEAGKIIRCTCGSKKCVNPEHFEITTYKKLGKELGAVGVMSGPIRSAAIARAKRKTSAKLTQAAVDDIRTSNETTVTLAKKYGIAQSHASRVKRQQAWRDFSSPWAGL